MDETQNALDEWAEKYADDPDVQAAVKDLSLPRTETGETAINQHQTPERLGNGTYVLAREVELLQFIIKDRDLDEKDMLSPRERVNVFLWRFRFEHVLTHMDKRYADVIKKYFYLNQSQESATGGRGGAWATRIFRAALGHFMQKLIELEDELRDITIYDAGEGKYYGRTS